MKRLCLGGALGAAACIALAGAGAAGPLISPEPFAGSAAIRVQAHGAAPGIRAGALLIEQPWSRATPAGAKVAAGYLRVTNQGTAPDRLIGASFARADHGEVHQMSMSEGVMKMAPVDGGIPLGPGETVELKPGGYHLMFMGLASQLKQGDAVAGTLVFEKAGTVPVTFQVGGIGAGTASQGHAQ